LQQYQYQPAEKPEPTQQLAPLQLTGSMHENVEQSMQGALQLQHT